MEAILAFFVCIAALAVIFIGIVALLLTSRVVIAIILGLLVVWLWRWLKKYYDAL